MGSTRFLGDFTVPQKEVAEICSPIAADLQEHSGITGVAPILGVLSRTSPFSKQRRQSGLLALL